VNHNPILVGLIGADIQMSKSPALHEEEGRQLGLNYHYELLDLTKRGLSAPALPELLAEEEKRGFVGSNITHPCKQSVIGHLTRLSEDAEMLGAVNTVVFRNGERIGHNTDWYGFHENFKRGLPDVGKSNAVLLGAGGAGVAVAHAGIKLGIERLSIFDKDSNRAALLSTQLNDRFSRKCAEPISEIGAALRHADGLIHATPTGMYGHPGLPIDADWLEQRHWVADIVYMPLETELLALAKNKGCRTLSGGGMAVFQAAAAFHLFTGIKPDTDRMSRHFVELCRVSP